MNDSRADILPALNLEQLLAPGLSARAGQLAGHYAANQPFPHIVIDDFFAPAIASGLGEAISAIPDRDYGVSFRSLTQRKMQLGSLRGRAPHIYWAYEALMSPEFTGFVESISGYPELEADRQFAGAGLHRYHAGSFAEIHLDSNRHPFDAGLYHRVNLIIFMSPGWRTEWNGELLLWPSRNNRPRRSAIAVKPVFNRAVIFEVAARSWHSVNSIRCPHYRTRNSMAIYYFNRLARAQDEAPRSVMWHAAQGWPRQGVFEVTNRVMRMAKPYARYLRWLRTNKFDGVSA
jgi:Rps23 Pro-64 3,4-dihydroxylase Tpa1-like proline 4-hydroxylase